MAEEKTKRPQRTAEERIADLKAKAEALELKVKEKKLASFSKDLESFTKLVNQLHTLYSKASVMQAELIKVRDENNIDAWIPDPWVEEHEESVSLFGPTTVFHVALEPIEDTEAGA